MIVKCTNCSKEVFRKPYQVARAKHYTACSPKCQYVLVSQFKQQFTRKKAPGVYKNVSDDNKVSRGEHRVLMEKKLGRRLKRSELVHHIDENKQHNIEDNLEVVSPKEHSALHTQSYYKPYKDETVKQAIELLRSGKLLREVREITGISLSHLSDLRRGKKQKTRNLSV